jgi:hypothetical protein
LKTVILLGLVAVVFLTGSIFATQASAQYQPQSGQHQFQGTRTPVNGTYTNSNYGVQVTLPDGWSGYEMKRTSGSTSVMIAPGGFQNMQGGQRPPVTMMISMLPKSSTTSVPQFLPRNMTGETCDNSTSTKTVGSTNLNEVVVDCSGNMAMKAKYEVAQTDSAYIVLGYRANPSSGFDSQVAAFDSMVGTLQIANPGSTSVVPEFPISAIGLVVAIMVGTVVILGRTQIMSNRI